MFIPILFVFICFTSNAQNCTYSVDIHEQQGKGIVGPGVNSNTSGLNFTIDASQANLPDNQSWIQVIDVPYVNIFEEVLEFRNTNGEVVVTTPTISIGQREQLEIRLRLGEAGEMESDDYLEIYYQLDDEALIPVEDAQLNGDFETNNGDYLDLTKIIDVKGKSTLRMVIKAKNNAPDERYRIFFLHVDNGRISSLFGFLNDENTVTESANDQTINTIVYRSHGVTSSSGSDFFGSQTVSVRDGLTGSATAGVDYRFTPFAFTFNISNNSLPCNYQLDVPVEILVDGDDAEAPETIDLVLEFVGNFGQTRLTNHTITINNTAANPLSVELTDFTAQPFGENQVHIQWQTATEINNDQFFLEHSFDGEEFTVIDEQTSKGASGQYQFTHQPKQSGQQFYRLTQKDFNGKKATTSVVQTFLERQQKAYVFNNPIANHLIINDASPSSVATIFSMSGQPLQRFKLSEGQHIQVLSHLSSGTYLLQIDSSNDIQNLMFIKN